MNTSKELPTNLIKICTDDLNEIIGGTVYPWPLYHDEKAVPKIYNITSKMYCVRYFSDGVYSTRIFKNKKEAYEFDALMNKK